MILASPVIALISLSWSTLTAVYKVLHRVGLRKSVKLPLRVISVGNFEVGGTGKTPVVAEIAREAVQRGLQPLILSRGYRGRWERQGGVISPHSGADTLDPGDTGDEPSLLHELCPHAWIGVGADRLESFERVMQLSRTLGARMPDLVILDDGLQHLEIARELDVILATSNRPWTKIFREFPVSSRKTRSVFAWTKGYQPPFGIGADASVVRLRWQMAPPARAGGSDKLWLVTGVADGRQVRDSLEAAGWAIEAFSYLEDHAKYSREWVKAKITRAKQSGLKIATTGKDWVKWRALGIQRDEVLVFEPEIVWDDQGRKLWLRELWGE